MLKYLLKKLEGDFQIERLLPAEKKPNIFKINKDFGCYNCRKAVVGFTGEYKCSFDPKNMQPISLDEYCSKHIHFRGT